jgi:hypothetical protein
MQYKFIENYHVENAILGKDFNLGPIGSFFHAFTLLHFLLGSFYFLGGSIVFLYVTP